MKKVFSVILVAMALLAVTTASMCNKNAQPAEEAAADATVVEVVESNCACADSAACAGACEGECTCGAEEVAEAAPAEAAAQ